MDLKLQKRRYIVEDNETDVNNKKSKRVRKPEFNLLQLNVDCLEKVFECLHSFEELRAVAITNRYFLESASYIFNKKYNNTLIAFDPFASNGRIFNNFLYILDGFGDKIKRLQVTFYHEKRYRNRNEKILSIIIEKCSKSVVELNLSNVQSDMIIDKPFPQMRKFTLNESYLSDSLTHVIQNSPNISSLEFYSVENVFNSKILEQKIPLMTHFGNYNQVIMDSEVENLQKFRCFINVNQQLISLGIGAEELERLFHYEEVRQQFFKTIHRKLPYPDHRSLITYLLPFESIYFGQLNQLSISMGDATNFLHCMRENRIEIAKLPLQQLEFYVDNLNVESVDLILHCRHLKRLRLYIGEGLDVIQLTRAALYLRQLNELDIFLMYKEKPNYSVIPEVIRIIIENLERDRHNKFVIGFELKYEKETARRYETFLSDFFSQKLPNIWHVRFETKNIEIKRQNSNKLPFLCAILEKSIA
ncbi:uncharacterized protein LOC116342585 [Contarinia nasturtii]|uniref:uncharacterized protein LOC116342585 n=1 Tax=Contarinia nasturtii TaxID=265458 RepID=UPI0012D38A25|nr:uncharacterized protein LOC116342585 [Contarinia nasturtii]XP_031626120.1 uncharacterized protein LOC116342585 [Contarinia nasturtii]